MKNYVKTFEAFITESVSTSKYVYVSVHSAKPIQVYLTNYYNLKLEGLNNKETLHIFCKYGVEKTAFIAGMKKAVELLNMNNAATNEVCSKYANGYCVEKYDVIDVDIVDAYIAGMNKQCELIKPQR